MTIIDSSGAVTMPPIIGAAMRCKDLRINKAGTHGASAPAQMCVDSGSKSEDCRNAVEGADPIA